MEEEEEVEEEEEEGSAQGDRLESEDVHQAPRPPELEPTEAPTHKTTTAPLITASQPADTAHTQQD